MKSINSCRMLMILPAICLGFMFQVNTTRAESQDFRMRISDIAAMENVTTSDVEVEINFGREVAARILGRYKILDDPKLLRYVGLVGRAVSMSSNRPELDFKFAILDSPTVNAYAAPGGYVFVTQGAMKLMADEAELAAVLAHEIAHTSQRHIVKELHLQGSEDAAQAGLAHLLGAIGDPTRVAFMQAVDQAMDILFEKGYQREDEFEADQVGEILLATTGYDSFAFKRYLEKAGQGEADRIKILSKTHPPFEERIAALNTLMVVEGLDQLRNPVVKERFDAQIR
ncbi:MAG: M48 family metalloprotease [Proteobacteria bacterium]|nr:M48 family metalloprotease [Pseudomonadota bacterium]MBU1687663.1 M48 family metalloprotease [Pseudomonadota bacterium]